MIIWISESLGEDQTLARVVSADSDDTFFANFYTFDAATRRKDNKFLNQVVIRTLAPGLASYRGV